MSYGTVEDWIAYGAARGETVISDTASEQALQRAQDHIKYEYVERFVEPYDEAAQNVEFAVYEAAKLELATPGFFSKTFSAADQKVLTKVDSIQWTPVGDARGASAARPVSTLIEAMLRNYLSVDGSGSVIRTLGGCVV